MNSAILLSALKLWQSLLHLLLMFGGRTDTLSSYMWVLMLFPATLFQHPLLTAQGWVVLKSPAVFFLASRLIFQAPTQPAEHCHELLGSGSLIPTPDIWQTVLRVIVFPQTGGQENTNVGKLWSTQWLLQMWSEGSVWPKVTTPHAPACWNTLSSS